MKNTAFQLLSLRASPAFAPLIVGIALSCGVSDRDVTVEAGGGTGAESSGGRSPNEGGDSSSAGRGGSATVGDAGSSGLIDVPPDSRCDPECTEDAPICEDGTCVACRAEMAPRCGASETPEHCEDGEWVAETPCSGNRPVCSNGTCGAFRLEGGFVSVGAASADGTIRLVDHGFEAVPTQCAMVRGDTVCISGGLRP